MFIFSADLFEEHYTGGAELTFGAVIDSAQVPCHKIVAGQLTVEIMKAHRDKFWIFGNYANLSPACRVYAIKNLNYGIVEFDYKYCKYRTEHLHIKADGACDCPSDYGKLAALFTAKSKINFWMSQGQLDAWVNRFPALANFNNVVLSSIFSDESLDHILSLDTTNKNEKWIVLGSDSWIKGKEDAIKYAEENNLDYEVLWGLEYKDFLKKLSESKGLIHLPRGYDTCPRMVIEARLLGCELALNDLVQHQGEDWWEGSDEELVSYLKDRASEFWKTLSQVEQAHLPMPAANVEEKTHFSIVIPSWNCEKWVGNNINSVLAQKYSNYTVFFVDDASTDDTTSKLQEYLAEYPDELQQKVHCVRNEENKKALHNICKSIELADPDSVIILLDGDDWFASTGVLAQLNQLYSNEDVWITTGSYVEWPSGRIVESLEVPAEAWKMGVRKFREPPGHPNMFSHLRTFRKSLYEKINQDDLKDRDGEYYRCTFDRALMYPMIEMSGPDHHAVIDRVMYVYNRENPLSVDRIDRANQLRIEKELRGKSSYSRVEM